MTKVIIMVLLSALLLMFLISCEEEHQPLNPGKDPEIKTVSISSTWNIHRQTPDIIEVEVFDPQGAANLNPVYLQVSNENGVVIFNDSLYDDGSYYHPQSGDVLAKDGFFRNRFRAADIDSSVGEYIFTFEVADKDGNIAAPRLIDVRFRWAEVAEIATVISPDSLKSGSVAAYLNAILENYSPGTDTLSVYVRVKKSGQPVVLSTITMFNDGNYEDHGDQVAGDSVFSYKMDSTFSANKQGLYDHAFQVESSLGDTSATVTRQIFLENKPGKVHSVEIPDSVKRPASGSVLVYTNAHVSDPQGLADVDSVYFTLQDSQGNFIRDEFNNLVKLMLYDDGDGNLHGDSQAGDGIYSTILEISSQNQLESYTLYFYMRDRVGQLSAVKTHPFSIY